ncbi:hypothetical protein MAE02_46830 [Microvirga aerophila]|uniref:Uncharacterized protein n=1 Tax=Microvirga aerophila TaxID=670291 RepID=A0A512BYS0_9HYPH|nr:hypothetical protein MAE02_46830 [Microvirga aerophila]
MPKYASSNVWLEEQCFHRSRARALDDIWASVITLFQVNGEPDLKGVEHNARVFGGIFCLSLAECEARKCNKDR